jgi:hypothetical protein
LKKINVKLYNIQELYHILCCMQLLAEEQTSGNGGFSLAGASLWKSAGEVRDDKLQKLAQAIPQLVKQVEVSSR